MNGIAMKSFCQTLLKLTSLAVLMVCASGIASAQDARIQTSQLEHLAAKASNTVDITIDERLMQFAGKFLSRRKGDEASVKEFVDGLKGVYVKSYEFETEGQYSPADIESIRSQLRGANWSKIVNVNSKKEGGVEVYLMTQGGKNAGLALLATEPKEITIINIVGPIDLDKLSHLEGNFGIPELDIERSKTKPGSKSKPVKTEIKIKNE
jgi:hypothetical protein